jgi:uncharacterized protein (TIGR02001 family)
MRLLSTVAAICLFSVAGNASDLTPSFKAAGETINLQGGFGAASDYTFRGISLTRGNAAASFGLEASVPAGIYAGVWSTTLFSNTGLPGCAACVGDTSAMADIYAGYRSPFLGFNTDFGVIQHVFFDQPVGAALDFMEAYVGASHPLGPLTLSGKAFYADDYAGLSEDALYTDGSASFALAKGIVASAGAGHQWFFSGFGAQDYTTWNVGTTLALTPGAFFDARYIDTNRHEFGKQYHARVVASVRMMF